MDQPSQPDALDPRTDSAITSFLRRVRTSLLASSTKEDSAANASGLQSLRSLPDRRRASDTEKKPDHTRNSAPVTTSAPSKLTDDKSNDFLIHNTTHNLVFDQANIHPARRTYSVDRVETHAPVTIQHYCHVCRSRFGPGLECTSCKHNYCQECIRSPEQQQPTFRAKIPRSRVPTTEALSTSSSSIAGIKRRASPHSNSYDRQRTLAPTVRRIYRACHRCTTPFIFTERVCQQCDHVQCSKCPRCPTHTSDARTSLQELGFDKAQVRERTRKLPRQRIRYTCERCGTLFREKNKKCDGCGHGRCDECSRAPPKRTSPSDPDPAVLRSLETRLAAFAIEPSTVKRRGIGLCFS